MAVEGALERARSAKKITGIVLDVESYGSPLLSQNRCAKAAILDVISDPSSTAGLEDDLVQKLCDECGIESDVLEKIYE